MRRARLMTTPKEFVLSRLSRQLYTDFLTKAKTLGFSFIHFQDFLPGGPPRPQRYIALRHDIDFAPSYSLEMAELEHEAGVRSTFFVLVDGQFYNPLQSEVIRQIRQIHSLGHEIGLHFAVSSAVHADIGKDVAFRLDVLSAIVGATLRSFSQHDPFSGGLRKGFDVLRATLHEQEIRRIIGVPGEGDRVVEGVAPLEAAEDRCLYFINKSVTRATRESLALRHGCIVIAPNGSEMADDSG